MYGRAGNEATNFLLHQAVLRIIGLISSLINLSRDASSKALFRLIDDRFFLQERLKSEAQRAVQQGEETDSDKIKRRTIRLIKGYKKAVSLRHFGQLQESG